jgi:hypothetical protein
MPEIEENVKKQPWKHQDFVKFDGFSLKSYFQDERPPMIMDGGS